MKWAIECGEHGSSSQLQGIGVGGDGRECSDRFDEPLLVEVPLADRCGIKADGLHQLDLFEGVSNVKLAVVVVVLIEENTQFHALIPSAPSIRYLGTYTAIDTVSARGGPHHVRVNK